MGFARALVVFAALAAAAYALVESEQTASLAPAPQAPANAGAAEQVTVDAKEYKRLHEGLLKLEKEFEKSAKNAQKERKERKEKEKKAKKEQKAREKKLKKEAEKAAKKAAKAEKKKSKEAKEGLGLKPANKAEEAAQVAKKAQKKTAKVLAKLNKLVAKAEAKSEKKAKDAKAEVEKKAKKDIKKAKEAAKKAVAAAKKEAKQEKKQASKAAAKVVKKVSQDNTCGPECQKARDDAKAVVEAAYAKALAINKETIEKAKQFATQAAAAKVAPPPRKINPDDYLEVTPTNDLGELDNQLRELGLNKKLAIDPKTLHHGKTMNFHLKKEHKNFVKTHALNCAGSLCSADGK